MTDGVVEITKLMQHFGRRGLMEPWIVYDWCNIYDIEED
jgi:hypothetical protein